MNEIPPPAMLVQLATGTWIAQCVHAVAKLGIADLVKDGPQSVASLAQATQTRAERLYRVLRATASVGLFQELADQQFALTPMAYFLQSDTAMSLRDGVVMFGEKFHFLPFGSLLESLSQDKSAFDLNFGMPVFDYLAQHPLDAAAFNAAMASFANLRSLIAPAYNFGQFRQLVDVGSGYGRLLVNILQAYPNLQGIVFDLPEVVAGAQAVIDAGGVTDRCQAIGGNFFEAVPAGADAYMMSQVIHDWDDAHAVQILQACHRVMDANAKLLVIDLVISPGNEPDFTKLMDINMLVMSPNGRERTAADFERLFAQAGFKLLQAVPTPASSFIMEGIKA
jgi:SAM-dependent methyltransferase